MPPPKIKGTLEVCGEFEPNPYYRQKYGNFCIGERCKHWAQKERICIDVDPAGNTYNEIPQHCKLHPMRELH